jgi:hypothetical protein
LRLILQLVFAMATLAPMLAEPAHAQNSAVYLVTYVEVLPDAVTSGTAPTKDALVVRSSSRKSSDGRLCAKTASCSS